MEIEIQAGVPIPEHQSGVPVYPWDKLEVGDSFEVDGVTRAKGATRYANRSRPDRHHICRSMGNDKARIWRVK